MLQDPRTPLPAHRTRRLHPLALAVVTAASIATLGACGGGGGDAASPAPPPPAPVTLTGTAATGAPFSEAEVRVYDRSGAQVGASTPVRGDGTWTLQLAANAQPPFVAIASRTEATGETQSLVSVLDSATSGGTTHLNLNPVTTLIATRLSPSGQPLALADEVANGSATVDAQEIADKLAEVRTLLAPYLSAAGQTAFDPLRDAFVVDGTGFDRLLDSLYVTIEPTSSGGANVEIGLRASDGGSTPPPVRFTSTEPIDDIVAANAAALSASVVDGQLAPAGTASLIADLLARMTACSALPLSERVAPGGTTAAAIVAPACRSTFSGDDPATYLHDGNPVGAGLAFSGMYTNGFTGAVFSQGSYEFARVNGDLVIGYRSRLASGATTYGSLVVRQEGGALKLIGNQYQYPGSVTAYHQYRVYPTLNQQDRSYHSSGYNLRVLNLTANGAPIFDRVEVITPGGSTLTLRPSAGSSVLNLVRSNGSVSGTTLLRLASAYASHTTPGSPADQDTNLIFAPQQYTDVQMAAIPAQSLWRFRYYLASDPTTLAAEQNYRTRSRAMTIGEFRARPLPRLTDASLAAMVSGALPSGVLPLGGAGPVAVNWEVPAGALPPVELTLYGVRTAGGVTQQSFNDSLVVPSTARSASIACSVATAGDAHCQGDGPNYAASTFQTGLHLHANDSAGRGFNIHYATYDLTP